MENQENTSDLTPQGANILYSSDVKPASILIDDHDNPLPEDLNVDSEAGLSLGGFIQTKGLRLWAYVLGGVLLVFIIVVALLARESSLFKGDVMSTLEAPDTNLDNFFMTASTPSATPNPTTTPEAPSAGPVIATTTTPPTTSTTTTTAANPTENLADFLEGIDDGATAPTVESLYSAAPVPTNTELGLNTYTSAEVIEAGEMQGDTGPALWLSLVPTMAYALSKFRRK